MSRELPSLDNRTFRMVSSTTSQVDPDSPTLFRYRERDGAIWGKYCGDTVTFGRFIGTRIEDTIRVSFVHVLNHNTYLVTGESENTIHVDESGLLRLVERYEMHGAPQMSVCVEVPVAS